MLFSSLLMGNSLMMLNFVSESREVTEGFILILGSCLWKSQSLLLQLML